MNKQLDMNIKAYEKCKSELEARHMGKVAIFSDGKLIGIYDDGEEAYRLGLRRFGRGNFTTHNIGEGPISLGLRTFVVGGRKEDAHSVGTGKE